MHAQGEGQTDEVASRDDLRAVMRRWSTGVTVITMRLGDEMRGVTVNSFTSVSLEPPLILFCLDRRARTHHLLLASEHFCINLLSSEQAALSDRFAGRRSHEHGDFSDISHAQTQAGAPILDGCLAWLDCRLQTAYPAGDHTLFLGLVRAAQTAADEAPLLYHAGAYHRLG